MDLMSHLNENENCKEIYREPTQNASVLSLVLNEVNCLFCPLKKGIWIKMKVKIATLIFATILE